MDRTRRGIAHLKTIASLIMNKRGLSRFVKVHPVLRSTFLKQAPANGIDNEDLGRIFKGCEFTTDWFSLENARLWAETFEPHRGNFLDVLEIGSWEGRSTVFLAWLFPRANITCVDTFKGGDEHQENEFAPLATEDRFRANTKAFSGRLTVLKGNSAEKLSGLEGTFDFVYVDGSHFYPDVMVDLLLSWRRLRLGGFMVMDDYFWTLKKVYGRLNPKLAIDQFLTAYAGQYRVLFSNPQICIQKVPNGR